MKKILCLLSLFVLFMVSPALSFAAEGGTGVQDYITTHGQKHTNRYCWGIWGLYKGGEICLETEYTVFSQTIRIDSVSTYGTYDNYPMNIEAIESGIISNDQRVVKTYGEYMVELDPLIKKIGKKRWRIETELAVKYAGDGKICFTAESKHKF